VGVTLLYSRLQVGDCMDGVKFELNDKTLLLLYTKNDSEWRQFVSLEYFILYLYCFY